MGPTFGLVTVDKRAPVSQFRSSHGTQNFPPLLRIRTDFPVFQHAISTLNTGTSSSFETLVPNFRTTRHRRWKAVTLIPTARRTKSFEQWNEVKVRTAVYWHNVAAHVHWCHLTAFSVGAQTEVHAVGQSVSRAVETELHETNVSVPKWRRTNAYTKFQATVCCRVKHSVRFM